MRQARKAELQARMRNLKIKNLIRNTETLKQEPAIVVKRDFRNLRYKDEHWRERNGDQENLKMVRVIEKFRCNCPNSRERIARWESCTEQSRKRVRYSAFQRRERETGKQSIFNQ